MKVKSVLKNKKLDVENYVNIETGETLLQEKSIITTKEKTNLVTISSNEYVVLDSQALKYCIANKLVSNKDLKYVIMLADTLKTEYNAIYKPNNTPHSIESLESLLGLCYNEVSKLLLRLRKKNILYLLIRSHDKVYLMNPYLARKRKTFNEEVVDIFPRLS